MIQVNRETLHRWLDELAEEDVPVVARLLRGLRATPAEVEPCPECGALEHVPNEETARALRESRDPANWIHADDAEDLFRKLGI